MKKITLIGLTVCCSLTLLGQQDPLYSQYQFNQMMINPAYAGIYNRFSAGLISRFQWVGIEGAPQTHTVTAQTALAQGRIGIGGLILSDRLGVNTNTEFQMMYAYNIKFKESKLSMGLQTGLVNFGYNYNNLELDYLDDPRLNDLQNEEIRPNFGAGFMYLNRRFFVGASVPRILNVDVNDGMTESERYKRHYYLSSGFLIDGGRFTKFKVTGLFRYLENNRPSHEIIFSSLTDGYLWAGISIRDLKHYGAYLMLEVKDNLRVAYSFELPANSLIQSSYGTHEIGIIIDAVVIKDQFLVNRYF